MKSLLRCLSVQLALAGALLAQFTGAIQGTITDSSNAVIPDARVTATNVATGISRTATSGQGGFYRILSLSPGVYSVRVEKEGFALAQREAVAVANNQVARVDFTLTVGGVTERITIADAPPVVETEQARVSGRIDRIQLKEIPLNGRNLFNLIALQPGVIGRGRSVAEGGGSRSGNDPFSGEAGAIINAGGQRTEANNFTVDNASINSGVRGGFTNIVPSAEAVEEVRVTVTNVSAVDGRNSGAQVEVVTKSGTNEFHGSAIYYFQNNTLSSRNTFEARVPVFRRNQFGYTLGGPILKNRTFFFTTYEGLRQSGGRGSVATVETPEFRDFVVRTRPNSIAARLLSEFRPLVYASTNFRDLGSPRAGVNVIGPADGIPDVGSAVWSAPSTRDANQFQLRIDHELRPGKDRLYGNYYRNQGESLDANLRPAFNRRFLETSQFANLNHTHIFSPTSINEFRAGVIRLVGGNEKPPHPEIPNISISGATGFPLGQFPNGWWQTNWSFKNVFSLIRGAHTLKLGGEYRRDFANNVNTSNYIPSYSFASILDFADDEALTMSRSVDPRNGEPKTVYVGARTREWALFVNDDWKVRSNLSLTLGLRYEVYGSIRDSHTLTNLIFGQGQNYIERLANARVDIVNELYPTAFTNFGPRFGFSWDPTSKGLMAVRGGYSLAFDRIYSLRIASYAANPPIVGTATLGPQLGTTFTYTLGDLSKPHFGYPIEPGMRLGLDERNGIRGARVMVQAADPNMRTPYVHNWFFGLQRQLPGRVVAEMNYIGSAGRHLLSTFNANRYVGDMLDNLYHGINPSFGNIRMVQTNSLSIYHGGTLRVARSFQQGFTVQGAYTFGKAISDCDAGDISNSFMDANNQRLDRAVTSWDSPQQLSVAGVWEIPFLRGRRDLWGRLAGGWQLSGTLIAQKGLPVNVVNNAAWPRGDFNGDGVTGHDRPNAPAPGVLRGGWTKAEFLQGVFRAADFPVPVRGTNGNLGRNATRGPGFQETCLALAKRFGLTEKLSAQLRIEAFNAWNTVNLNNPVSDLNNINFGRSTSANTPRTLQAGLRLDF